MKRTFLPVALLTVFFAVGAYAQSGRTTRYWDGCKPSCGWTSNASGSPNGTCKSCNVTGGVVSNDGEQSACSGGSAFTCMKQAPWAIDDNLSYGFVANNNLGCGKCMELTFTNTAISGKKMIVMISNIGQINGEFDIMIPGGGVGDFDALSRQIQQNGGNTSDLGDRYGGFGTKCRYNGSCVKEMCAKTFGSAALADLKAGCDWYVDWFKTADNPNVNYKEVPCPQALIDKYKGNFSATPTPPAGSTYTLTVNRNPANGGTTNPASSQANINGGSQVNISATPASGYTFTNWTVSGSGTLANANSASTSVTVNGNITVTANFSGGNTNPNPVRGDTIKVEAESFASKNGDGMRVTDGVLGYIENGNSATYNVTAGKAGTATVQFRIATEVQSSFTVTVNGQNVGTVSQGSTGGWSTFVTVTLNNAATVRAGSNTIVLNFGSAVNIDYFLLIGDIKSTTPVRHTVADAFGRSPITLTPARNGFKARLPASHGFTSYSVIDLQGREIRSGRIGESTTDLSVSGLKHSVVFLRLEGKGRTPTALKVVTY